MRVHNIIAVNKNEVTAGSLLYGKTAIGILADIDVVAVFFNPGSVKLSMISQELSEEQSSPIRYSKSLYPWAKTL